MLEGPLRKLLTVALTTTALGLTTPAHAADTWLYYNNTYIAATDVADLRSALTGVGATITTTTSST